MRLCVERGVEVAKQKVRISRQGPRSPVEMGAAADLPDVLRRLTELGKHVDEEMLRAAHGYAAEMHRDQVRRSGEPYLNHPVQVAYLLADLKFDQTCVAVGLLHDVLEDTPATLAEIERRFGDEIAALVDGVTKIGRHEYVRRDEAQAETFRKLVLASAKDIRVILVKLVDRYHNMMTLEHMPSESRRRIAQETLEIYAPIAHRLGMAKVQGDLEDMAFYHLYPHQFGRLQKKLRQKVKVGKGGTTRIRDRLAASLEEAGLEAEIGSRVKRYYSIYRKLRRQGIDIAELFDYLAFRIITRDVRDCYAALGVVHQNWRPVPGRFKDYIAMPKPNLYQSLHTTVVGDEGQPFEVQIRTIEMDLIAEEGIAAHWRYKRERADAPESDDQDSHVPWLRQLLEWQQEVPDPRAFMTALKIDLYPDEVYVFTPKGEVLSFPRGATPLDFAYKVHTELGHHCVGARLNGKLVPIRTELKNGDMVEIVTSASRFPSRDWLNFVRTSRARSKIRNWLNTEQNKRSMEIGRRLVERELKRYPVNMKKLLELPELRRYLDGEGLARPDDLFNRIGFGKLHARHVLDRVLGEGEVEKGEEPSRIRQAVNRILPFGSAPIEVSGQGDLLAYLAKCCNPLPGDRIVGYVTRGRGVSVHSVECSNVRKLIYNPEREIEVTWARSGQNRYAIVLEIHTEDRPGMLAEVTDMIARVDSDIRQIEADTEVTGRGLISVVVEVRNRKHLDKLRQGLRGLPGVIEVRRKMEAVPIPER